VVAVAEEVFKLNDVDSGSAAGTADDPYIAEGFVFGGCYSYEPAA